MTSKKRSKLKGQPVAAKVSPGKRTYAHKHVGRTTEGLESEADNAHLHRIRNMRDEARSTQMHSILQSTRLRQARVTFVTPAVDQPSAPSATPASDPQHQDDSMLPPDVRITNMLLEDTTESSVGSLQQRTQPSKSPTKDMAPREDTPETVGLIGMQSGPTDQSTGSDVSDDEIIFYAGRKGSGPPRKPRQYQSCVPQPEGSKTSREISSLPNYPISSKQLTSMPIVSSTAEAKQEAALSTEAIPDVKDSDILSDDVEVELAVSDDASLASPSHESDIADYVENMRKNGELDSDFDLGTPSRRTKGGASNEPSGSDSESDDLSSTPDDSDPLNDRSTTRVTRSRTKKMATIDTDEEDIDALLLLAGLQGERADPNDSSKPAEEGRPRKRTEHWRDTLADISDSDMAAYLQSSWEKDRTKKKSKKAERELLRATKAASRRGSKLSGDDFKAAEFRISILSFMHSDAESLGLPAMSNAARRCVHEITHALGLDSRSKGTKHNRAPCIYKTQRSIDSPIQSKAVILRIVDQRLKRFGFATEESTSGARVRFDPPKGPRARGDQFRYSGRGTGAARSRDGEVVGAGAPEIGQQNRGRLMLEKLGWSSGTALGALNNKGIMQPVTHVVKTSKTGLG